MVQVVEVLLVQEVPVVLEDWMAQEVPVGCGEGCQEKVPWWRTAVLSIIITITFARTNNRERRDFFIITLFIFKNLACRETDTVRFGFFFKDHFFFSVDWWLALPLELEELP